MPTQNDIPVAQRLTDTKRSPQKQSVSANSSTNTSTNSSSNKIHRFSNHRRQKIEPKKLPHGNARQILEKIRLLKYIPNT